MKSIVKISMLIGVLMLAFFYEGNAQITSDPAAISKEYDNLGEVLKNPEKVYRLNLSNQNFNALSDSIWK